MILAYLRRTGIDLLIVLGAVGGAFMLGRVSGEVSCQVDQAQGHTVATVAAAREVRHEATATIAVSQRTGKAHAQQRRSIDRHFTNLEQRAADAQLSTTAPVDSRACVLPDDRLQLWADANAGPWAEQGHPGAAGRGAAGVPAETASAPLGGDARPGVEPPAGGAPVPPASQPDVPADRLRAEDAGAA